MYGFLWRILPGPTWLKLIEAAIIITAVAYALLNWGYPWISDRIEQNPVIGN
ncbi:hypothetical protein GCM10010401_00420 [Rarobacter faecitabidus]|uniref:Uncharacterized protein n=1 Tax=Rarobacter faecitabidus TaxID=13243 RepID=A0A542ZWT9_RARFA|nr:hypothetical protein [Rarobacter faecitabidus]TQL64817.1 hypothetical protein FB461_1340 [Rarobacter faecitabidus]